MSAKQQFRGFLVGMIGFAALVLPGLAAQPTTVDLSSESVGAEPKSFVPVVGFWRIEARDATFLGMAALIRIASFSAASPLERGWQSRSRCRSAKWESRFPPAF